MYEHLPRPADKQSLHRPPLITPSASPPVFHVSQHRDRPPPAKRPRLSATPSSSSSVRRGSSIPNVSDLRLESRDRLLKTWDQLAERYCKPLDEDDIVDLRELKILKDRGVTRAAARSYPIGSFGSPTDADTDADDAASQGADDEIGGEEDESADELDLLSDAPVPDVPEDYKFWYVPPADVTNAEDAEAFREFEEAEKKMKELGGAHGDDEEDEEAPVAGLQDGDVGHVAYSGHDEKEDDLSIEDDKEESPEPSLSMPKPQRRKSRPPAKPPGDDSSEDELAAWVIDDTPITPRRTVPPKDDIIDLTSPSPPRSPRGRSRSRAPRAQSRARSQARSKSQAPVAAAKRPKTPDHELEFKRFPSPDQVLQLLTPPRSSSVVETPCIQNDEPPPPPAETPSPKLPTPRARYTPRPRTPPSEDEQDLSSMVDDNSVAVEHLPTGPPKKAKKRTSLRGLKPEVVISASLRKLNNITSSARPSPPETHPSNADTVSKGKSKSVKDLSVQPSNSRSTPNLSERRRSQSQPRTSTRESGSPKPLPPSKGRKRRRVSSLSPLSDRSPAKAVTAEPDLPNHRLMRKQPPRVTAGDIPPPNSSPTHSDDDDDVGAMHAGPSHSHGRGIAPQMSPFPDPPPMFSHYPPRQSDASSASARRGNDDHHAQYPALLQDPQAQSWFMQAWHSLSYLMASGAISTPPLPGAGYPPGLPYPPSPWPSYTPSHQRYHTHPSHLLGTPSSEAGPSRSSTYSTPTHHPHPYPYLYNPGFSNGTLPPSSPFSSPATSSPILRPASVPPGQRSRSRGRHVSFKLDDKDRPLPPTPPKRAAMLDSENEPDSASALGSASGASKTSKGKGKARAEPQNAEAKSADEQQEEPSRGRASQRARTPGPPSQREKGGPNARHSTPAVQRSVKKANTPKAAQRRN